MRNKNRVHYNVYQCIKDDICTWQGAWDNLIWDAYKKGLCFLKLDKDMVSNKAKIFEQYLQAITKICEI